jgi:hypothetical protein
MEIRRICRLVCGIAAVLLLAAAATGQEKRRATTPQTETAESDSDPRRKTKPEQPTPKVSFTDSLLLGMRNNASFSIGVYEGYNSDILSEIGRTSPFGRADTITSVYSRFFAQVQGRRSQFSMDYLPGYRMYRRSDSLNGVEHRGSLAFRFQASRRSWIEISEHLESAPNDLHSLMIQPLSPTGLDAGFPAPAIFDRQRIFTNLATTTLGFQLGRRSQLSFSGSHLIQRFQSRPQYDSDGFLAGVNFQRQFNRWLAFTTNYQFKLSKFNTDVGQANTHRFEVAGLDYHLRPTLRLFASGGIEYTEFKGTYQPGAALRSGIEKTTPTMNLTFEYERGVSSSLGLGTMARGNRFAFRFNRRITDWLNLLATSAYSRNSAFVQPDSPSEPLHMFQAQPRLEFAVRPNLIFLLSYDYLNQHTPNLGLVVPNVNRYYVTFGFEYVLGARR